MMHYADVLVRYTIRNEQTLPEATGVSSHYLLQRLSRCRGCRGYSDRHGQQRHVYSDLFVTTAINPLNGYRRFGIPVLGSPHHQSRSSSSVVSDRRVVATICQQCFVNFNHRLC